MTRLNQTTRRIVTSQIVTNAIAEDTVKVAALSDALATKIYDLRYSDADKKLMAAAPAGAFATTATVRVAMKTGYSVANCSLLKARPVFYREMNYGSWIDGNEITPELRAEFEVMRTARDAVSQKAHDLRDDVTNMLQAYTTVEQAIKGWPAAESFLTRFLGAPPATKNLPAVVPAALNKKLKLPPKRKAKAA